MPNSNSALRCTSTEELFKGMGQQFVEIATGKFQGEAALVNGWEAQTAQAQANGGRSLAGGRRYESDSCLRILHKGWRHILSVSLLVESANGACWRVEA